VTGGVALFLLVFVTAPLSQAPGPSIATMNLAALTGGSTCGLADHVVVDGRPVTELIDGVPVFADQVSAALWPCADQIAVRHGIAEPPRVRLRAGDLLEGAIENNSVFVPNGGVLAGIDRTSGFVELPSALDPPPGSPMAQWGHVELVVPIHPPGGYDLTVGRAERAGWARLPTLSGVPYTGRTFIG
jgi:arabinosyltransferase B/arabinosyltransferase C